ncbi:MAG: efflux RND transporter periplasmic adaptor subunit [Runella sp.]
MIFYLGFGALIFSCQSKSETTSPTYESLTEAVYASGNVYPRQEYRVFANADGFLQRQMVEEGDFVTKNQLLFVLESDAQNARSEAAGNIYRQSEVNLSDTSPVLQELEAQIRAARIKLRNDSANYERYRALRAQNVGTTLDYDRAKLAYETAQEDLKARQNALKRVRNQLYIDLQNTRSAYRINTKEGDNYRVRSFEAGKIYEIYKKPGEMVRRTEAIALIGSSKDLYVQMAIDESDFSKIKVGQEVLIKTDVYQEKVFKARVTKIFPKLNRIDQSFRVDAEFVGDTPEAYYGLTVEANIIVSQNPKALTIPKTFVVGSDSVWVEKKGEKKKIKFEKGAENFEKVEVKSGLTVESILLKP